MIEEAANKTKIEIKVSMVYMYMTLYVQGTCMYLRYMYVGPTSLQYRISFNVENIPQKLYTHGLHPPIIVSEICLRTLGLVSGHVIVQTLFVYLSVSASSIAHV